MAHSSYHAGDFLPAGPYVPTHVLERVVVERVKKPDGQVRLQNIFAQKVYKQTPKVALKASFKRTFLAFLVRCQNDSEFWLTLPLKQRAESFGANDVIETNDTYHPTSLIIILIL